MEKMKEDKNGDVWKDAIDAALQNCSTTVPGAVKQDQKCKSGALEMAICMDNLLFAVRTLMFLLLKTPKQHLAFHLNTMKNAKHVAHRQKTAHQPKEKRRKRATRHGRICMAFYVKE
ncbi:hypothetical protein C0J52_11468 [Blattella germanica]|nr:hypothetical protein C0J52_11468 [Blattella germanica]